MLERKHSKPAHFKSKVPQESVFGPLPFLVYINDITQNIQLEINYSPITFFVFREINNPSDRATAQHDPNTLTKWTSDRLMHPNAKRSQIIQTTKKKIDTKLQTPCNINVDNREQVT